MSIINIRGIDFYYQHYAGNHANGSLIFIHGSGGSHEVWSNQMKLGLHNIMLDLPGHGRSGGEPAASIGESAKKVAEFLSAIQLPSPLYLVGHSMGAAIAIMCALNYPDLLSGIILIGAGQRMKVMPALLDDLRQGKNDPAFIRMGFSSQTPKPIVENMVKNFAEVPASILYADFLCCSHFDVSQELEKINIPVLVIVGSHDKLTPPKLSQYLFNHINKCRLEIIPGAGHFTMLEKPKEVNRLIDNFVS